MQQSNTKPKILYVDDEEDNLNVFKASFRRYFEIYTAKSASEGSEILKEINADIIISDQRMPEKSGVDFLKSLPDIPLNIRMILSGYSDSEVIVDALNSSKIFKYLTKPYNKTEFLEICEEALSMLNKKRLEKSVKANNTDKVEVNFDKDDKEEAAFKNMQMLSEIGQDIISNLTNTTIVDSAYENINSLMDATVFAIGIYNDDDATLQYSIMERGVKFDEAFISINSEEKPGAWTFVNKKEIFTNDWRVDYEKYIKGDLSAVQGEICDSMIYLPLLIHEKAVGVITVQAFVKNAYTLHHLNILRNIAIYVATALENANTYHLIESQKAEIEQKNTELENKVTQRTEELQLKNIELESAHSNIKLISEIGQQIISTLSLDKIIERVYENVNALMDATMFGIGIYNEQNNTLAFPATMEKGKKLPFYAYDVSKNDRVAIWCFNDEKEIIINDYQIDYRKFAKSIPKVISGETPESLIYLPLFSSKGAIGVITVQSFKKHIYSQYHIDILRSLGSYIAIAIQNSTSYNKMTEAFKALKLAQTKLVESEKMASLGILTAGVAHEINNPVNFITGGIESISENFQELKPILNFIVEPNKEGDELAHWNLVRTMQKEIDLNSLVPEFELLINTVKNGANRTAEIVKGLRNFTRLDESDMKMASVTEGINNTLAILNNKLKDRVTVTKDFKEVPHILCYPGQLNQVFMNILSNAADSILEKGQIDIKVQQQKNQLIIVFKDNGIGMTDEVKQHIFEPFYTTKEVGSGTGLGLSISYSIIEKHHGKIEVESVKGKGTEFMITLPITKES